MRQNAAAPQPDLVPFSYDSARELPSDAFWGFPEVGCLPAGPQQPAPPDLPQLQADFDSRLAEERVCSFAHGHARGFEEGRLAERAALASSQAEETAARSAELARLLDQFASERDRYLERIETEAVRLALAIAARILRREAQSDPLLLLGAVRVALGQLAGATRLRLRVPAAHHALWSEAVALLPARAARPEIVSDDTLRLGECTLESELGSVDLAVPSQLAEIERRLFASASDPAVDPVPERQP